MFELLRPLHYFFHGDALPVTSGDQPDPNPKPSLCSLTKSSSAFSYSSRLTVLGLRPGTLEL